MELKNRLEEFLKSKNIDALSDFLDDSHDIDVVTVLDDFNDEELQNFISLLDYEDVAGLVEEADIDLQLRVLKLFDTFGVIEIFGFMSADDIADILGAVSTKRRKELISYMKASDQKDLKLLLSYGDDTAGGIMTTEFIALKKNLTVKEAIIKIKNIAPKTEVIEEFFITDHMHKLVGTVDLRNLLVSDESVQLEDIMDSNPVYIFPNEDQEDAANLVTKYDLKVLPVVNRKMALLGIITVDDIIDVINEEHEEDVLAMGGVSADEGVESSLKESIKNRFPWLIINLFTAFITSFVIGKFSATISAVVALAATSPIVTGMSGNSGTQALSVTITAMATGEIDRENLKKIFIKEGVLGLINGFVVGFVAGLVMYLRYQNPYISLILLISMSVCLAIANMSGMAIPLVMKKLKFDPALSSGIFLTTITDVVGNLTFLALATFLLSKLL